MPWMIALIALGLAACNGQQSMLERGGPAAQSIETLWWIMLAGATVIFAVVLGLVGFGGWRARRATPGMPMVVVGGFAMPVVVLTGLTAYSVAVGESLGSGQQTPALRIEVQGRQWWWRVNYPDTPDAVLANEIRIPVGVPVRLLLGSADVIHSLWVPGLAGKVDMIPGRRTHLDLVAERPGVYRGQCAEFCGAQHALMGLYVVAVPPAEFDAWLARQGRPAPPPSDPFLQRGRDVFMQSGCGACHTVRGTPAAGTLGPDLTHVGGRLSIGAGLLPGNVAGIQGWIADAQNHKPGNFMPSFRQLDGRDLRAVATWLADRK